MGLQRYRLWKGSIAPLPTDDFGDYVLFSDHQSSLAEKEQRIKVLERLINHLTGLPDPEDVAFIVAEARKLLEELK